MDTTEKSEAELHETYNGAQSIGEKVLPKDELELSRSPPSGKEGQHQDTLKRMRAEAAQP